MEVAAAAIAFAQGIGMIATGIRTLHSIRQAPAEFMDLLNQLSTLNGRAELLRRSLESFAATHADVRIQDIDTVRNLQLQFEEISNQLNDTTTNFIAKSRGLDSQGRHRIPRILWQREQSNLMRLRERVRQLSSEMADCLVAINTSQGVRQTGLVLDVRAVMEQSFADVGSQIQHGHTLTERNHEAIHHVVQQNETQTALLHSTLANHQEASATISRRLDVFEARVETQISRVMANLSFDRHSSRATQGSQTRAQFDHTVVSVSTTLRETCPPNCRCQCHRTSYARTPEWLTSVMGSLFIQYKSIPMLGIKKCDMPLCKSASQSSIQLQWCFPRWLVTRALVASISWSSINDDGAALFLKIPRSIFCYNRLFIINDPRPFIKAFKTGELRPTDILGETGENFLTASIHNLVWGLLPVLLQLGLDPRMRDLTGRSAIHWARQRVLQDYISEDTPVTLRQIAAMELEDAEPLTMIHQAIRGEAKYSLCECIQMEPQHINTVDDVGYAPLHWAIWKQDMAAFQILMKASADINQQTSYQRETPLHFACGNHNVDMVRTLLDSGASTSSPDYDGWTPLHAATQNIEGRPQEIYVVKMLLDAHADPNCGSADGITPMRYPFGSRGVDLSHVTAVARLLIDAGGDLEAKNIYGRAALLYACRDGCKNLPILIDLGADVKAVDFEGHNMLSTLVRNNLDLEPSLVHPQWLVGLNADAREMHDRSPLDLLAERVRDPITWKPLTIRVVVDMVDLILGTREVNWEAGLFLDEKQELKTDGSHARMRRWVMHQRRLMQRDTLWGDSDCEEDDLQGWYEDKYNESSPSEIGDWDHHVSDDSDSRDGETMRERDDDQDEEDDNDDDDNNDNDGRDWSDGEDSITFHDAHETLE